MIAFIFKRIFSFSLADTDTFNTSQALGTIHTTPVTMNKKITPQQNQSNQPNANKGTSGTNKQYSQAQGNRGKQMNTKQNAHKK